MTGNQMPGSGRPAARAQEDTRCERCGSLDAPVVCGGRRLCEDCYYLYGSCCMEFGADDLWSRQSD